MLEKVGANQFGHCCRRSESVWKQKRMPAVGAADDEKSHIIVFEEASAGVNKFVTYSRESPQAKFVCLEPVL